MRAEWDNKAEPYVLRECAGCGKKFYPAPHHQYVTYRMHGGRPKKTYYCKWSCYNHRDEPNTVKVGAKSLPVLMYDKDGNLVGEFEDAQQAAMKLVDMGYSGDNRQVQRVCRGELKHYHRFIFKYKE